MIKRSRKENSLVPPSQAGEEESFDGIQGKNQIDQDQLRAMNARRRVAMWANNCMMDDKMIHTLQYGVYGKGNANNHKFRTVEKGKFLSQLPFVNRK
jgi:hypothetical protein